jgi:hypothetical protein
MDVRVGVRSCSCVAHGKIDDHLHGEGSCGPCCIYYLTAGCCLPMLYFGPKLRQEIRHKYNLAEEPCGGTCLQQSSDMYTCCVCVDACV